MLKNEVSARIGIEKPEKLLYQFFREERFTTEPLRAQRESKGGVTSLGSRLGLIEQNSFEDNPGLQSGADNAYFNTIPTVLTVSIFASNM